MYGRFFEVLRKATKGKWLPKMIMADLESAIHAGVKVAFPDGTTQSRKCWFHLTQAVRRHLDKKGMNVKIVHILFFSDTENRNLKKKKGSEKKKQKKTPNSPPNILNNIELTFFFF